MISRKRSHLRVALAVLSVLTACATHIEKPDAPPQPSRVKLGQFETVVLAASTFQNPELQDKSNLAAAKKIDENLAKELQSVFPNLVVGPKPEAAQGRVLSIEPVIEDIKFIGGAARFWVGAMAGSSAVRLKVVYRDLASSEVIADPVFFQKANAFAGAASIGGADNMMLVQIAQVVAQYSAMNQ